MLSEAFIEWEQLDVTDLCTDEWQLVTVWRKLDCAFVDPTDFFCGLSDLEIVHVDVKGNACLGFELEIAVGEFGERVEGPGFYGEGGVCLFPLRFLPKWAHR